MARKEQDREDLLREATALVERAEVRTASEPETVVIGFRRDGCASVYFGAEPAYHFNTRHELRRAFVEGQLWKAQAGRLVALSRERTEDQVQLTPQPLTDAQQQLALDALGTRLRQLATELSRTDTYSLVGQVPDEVDVLARVRGWLAGLRDTIIVAPRPNAE